MDITDIDTEYYKTVWTTQNDPNILKDEFQNLINDCLRVKEASGSKVPCSVGLEGPVDLLRDAINIMDEYGRSIPGNSKILWDQQWDELRLKVYKAYETLSEKAA